jgi:hypothetical protein
MLVPAPTAVLTPFSRGRKKLPTEGDVERICSHTDDAFITASPKVKKRNRPRAVERMLREAVRYIEPVHGRIGHVRLRAEGSGEPGSWNVELFGAAMPLRDLAA